MNSLIIFLVVAQASGKLGTVSEEYRWDLIATGTDEAVVATVTDRGWRLAPLLKNEMGEADEFDAIGPSYGLCGNISLWVLENGTYRVAYDGWGSSRSIVLATCALSVGNGISERIALSDGIGIYRASGRVSDPGLGLQDEQWQIYDLHCPTPIAKWDGNRLLFAGTQYGLSRQFIWLGDLALRRGNELTSVSYIGEGDEPKCAWVDGVCVVVGRICTPLLDKRQWSRAFGPIVWYRSEDLNHWRAMGPVEPGLVFGGFDVAVIDGKGVIASVVINPESRDKVGTRHYTLHLQEQKWVREEGIGGLEEFDRFRLLGNGKAVAATEKGVVVQNYRSR